MPVDSCLVLQLINNIDLQERAHEVKLGPGFKNHAPKDLGRRLTMILSPRLASMVGPGEIPLTTSIRFTIWPGLPQTSDTADNDKRVDETFHHYMHPL